MTYRLIHDSDLNDVANAAVNHRAAFGPSALTDAIEHMFARNEPACTEEEARSACIKSERMTSGFSSRLADLWWRCDNDNDARLRAAFAYVFTQYANE